MHKYRIHPNVSKRHTREAVDESWRKWARKVGRMGNDGETNSRAVDGEPLWGEGKRVREKLIYRSK